MDKRYYYRMLGVREDATRSQIDAAYEKRMKALQAPDYADDPEYAHKKMVQTKQAYKVLTGAAAPATRAQRENHFERIKDALDGGEDSVRTEKRRIHRKHTIDDSPVGSIKELAYKISDAAQQAKETIQGIGDEFQNDDGYDSRFDNTFDSGERLERDNRKSKGKPKMETSDNKVKGILSIAVLVIGLFSGVVTSCDISDTPAELEYVLEEEYYINENFEDPYSSRMAAMNTFAYEFDYYSNLSFGTQDGYSELIRWDSVYDETVSDELYNMAEILDAPYGELSHSDYREMIFEISGLDYYLEEAGIDECVDFIVRWIEAPEFSEIAGATELYNNMPIMNYTDYIRYLNNVIEEQGPDIWGDEL